MVPAARLAQRLSQAPVQRLYRAWRSHPASYHGESRETVMAVLGKMQAKEPEILGADPFAIQAVSANMDKMIAGNYAAKAAVEMAVHDLAGKVAGLSTYKMLGLSNGHPPMTDFTISIDNLDMIERKTEDIGTTVTNY